MPEIKTTKHWIVVDVEDNHGDYVAVAFHSKAEAVEAYDRAVNVTCPCEIHRSFRDFWDGPQIKVVTMPCGFDMPPEVGISIQHFDQTVPVWEYK